MGCSASADTGTQYDSLGNHGQQSVKRDTQRQPSSTQQTQQLPQKPKQPSTQQQQQQPTQQETQQSPTPPPPQYDQPPPPSETTIRAPIVGAQPKREDESNRPVSIKSKDVKSGVDFYNTDNMATPGLPDFTVAEYIPTDIGTYEIFLDLRTSADDFPTQDPPSVEGDLYTDYEFTLEIAHPKRQDLEWKRPVEICEAPVLFSEGTTRFDIGQGELGTCWFLAMVANIADKPRLLRRVIPENAYKVGRGDYDGVFHCRFWRFGVWNNVYIDDFLPIVHGESIMGAHSATDKNEMWVSLLEKAFAKLYGSYLIIEAGLTADSYMNLTGGTAEFMDFKKKKIRPQRLFSRLRNAFKCSTTMVGCSVASENDGVMGLVGGHAYSMNGAFKVGDAMLVRIHNPWGSGEWTGPWSDGSAEWQSAPGECVPPPSKDDGEFYMEVRDFIQFFADCTICNLTPDLDREDVEDTLGYVTSVYGNWREGKMGGFQQRSQNPHYSITLGEEGMDENGRVPVVVQLIQRTYDRQDDMADMRCDFFKVLDQNYHCMSLEDMGDKSNMYNGNTQITYRFLVDPGTYVAVPSTLEAGHEKEFLLRFFTAGPVSNPHEVEEFRIMNGRGRNGDEPYDADTFGCTKSSIGAFQCGFNAGGQVACDGFSNNPQYLLTVNEEQTFRIEVMQPDIDNAFPIGIKLFPASSDIFPADHGWLMNNYDNAMRDNDGGDGPFQYGSSTGTCYSVTPGTYILLIHCNTESDENDFSFAIYSQKPIEMQSAHV